MALSELVKSILEKGKEDKKEEKAEWAKEPEKEEKEHKKSVDTMTANTLLKSLPAEMREQFLKSIEQDEITKSVVDEIFKAKTFDYRPTAEKQKARREASAKASAEMAEEDKKHDEEVYEAGKRNFEAAGKRLDSASAPSKPKEPKADSRPGVSRNPDKAQEIIRQSGEGKGHDDSEHKPTHVTEGKVSGTSREKFEKEFAKPNKS